MPTAKDLRLFEITTDGIVVGERVGDHQGLLTGSPSVVSPALVIGHLVVPGPGVRGPDA